MDGDDGDLISVRESSTGSRKKAKKITKRKREQADRYVIANKANSYFRQIAFARASA